MKRPPLHIIVIAVAIFITPIVVFIVANALGSGPWTHNTQIKEMMPGNTEASDVNDGQQGLPQDEQESIPSEAHPEEPLINYQEQGGVFELPVSGATGWAARSLPLREEPQRNAGTLQTLVPGQGFVILEEQGDWWSVQLDIDTIGWVEHSGCFINLPDIIPSIVYRISNAQSSLKRSSGFEIPNITGQVLYDAWTFNQRLNRHEFIAPALYATSGKIAQIQRIALSNGDTIVMYEAFRPRETQQKVVSNLRYLMNTNEEVNSAINTPPWSINSFIATSISNHQRGAAIDVSLGKVVSLETRASGGFAYIHITESDEYDMPSPMHELSPQAAASRITDSSGAARLRGYCVDEVGFRPISSEWWHFNDPEGIQVATRNGIDGAFSAYSIHSMAPDATFEADSVIVFSSGLPDVEDPPQLPAEEPDELSADELEELDEQFIAALIAEMSLQEQIMQLFILGYETETAVPTDELSDEPEPSTFIPGAGGYVVSADGTGDAESVRAMLEAMGEQSGVPPYIFFVRDGDFTHELEGLRVSYPMNTEQITSRYTSAEVALMVIQAGGDMILLPQDPGGALTGLIDAVQDGTIQRRRITESLSRILKTKLAAGLIHHEPPPASTDAPELEDQA